MSLKPINVDLENHVALSAEQSREDRSSTAANEALTAAWGLIEKLRAMNDGRSRPVSIIEREACGQAADAIEHLMAAVDFAHCGGFEWPADPFAIFNKATGGA